MILILPLIVLSILVCGKEARVIGGAEVYDTTTFPWIVRILNRTSEGLPYSDIMRSYCAGSIIDQLWILTAAHCVDDKQAHEISILAGTYNLSNMDMGFLRNVSVVHTHEDYENFTNENDIALLKLEKPLDLSDSVAIISPADKNDPQNPGQIYTLAGWGAYGYSRKSRLEYKNDKLWNVTYLYYSYEPILKAVDVAEVSQEVCLDFFVPNWIPNWKLLNETLQNMIRGHTDKRFCAGNVVGENACFGDSGGPLSMTVDSTDILYGITSMVFKHCGGEEPALYTDVAMYQDWIANITGLSNASSNKALNVTVYVVIGLIAGILCFFGLIIIFYRYTASKKQKKIAEYLIDNEVNRSSNKIAARLELVDGFDFADHNIK